MASPAPAPREFAQLEAARQSLIAISQSVPELGPPRVAIRPPHGGMESAAADEKYRTKLISISNQQSPDAARPTPCPPKNAAA